MATVQRLPGSLSRLARQFEAKIGDARLARRAMRLIQTQAADQQLALATISKLAEESSRAIQTALSDTATARDLIFCVGASEIVAAEISNAGARWLELFDSARSATADSMVNGMRCDLSAAGSRADAARQLEQFKRRNFFFISIADLTRHIDVNLAMLLMSRLADECIRAAFAAAVRLAGEGAHEAG